LDDAFGHHICKAFVSEKEASIPRKELAAGPPKFNEDASISTHLAGS
jgi:hypothetical protein